MKPGSRYRRGHNSRRKEHREQLVAMNRSPEQRARVSKRIHKFEDPTGMVSARLTVLRELPHRKGERRRVECKCSCGQVTVTFLTLVKSGRVKSCGCLRFEAPANVTHGQKGTRLYRIWTGMKTRCLNPAVVEYPRYGGRGIGICPEWLEFEGFYEWALASGYREHLTIDRIDNDGDYEPSNCRWATYKQQANNRRNNRRKEIAA